MTAGWILATGLVVLGGLATYTHRKALREIDRGPTFSTRLVSAVWTLYGVHAGLLAFAAWHGAWAFPLAREVALPLGIGSFALGMSIDLAGVWEFRSFCRMNGQQTDKLVTTGIYRYTRNPQNVGLGVAYVGVAILGRSGFALLLAGFFWAVFFAYVPSEERLLERIYGDEYRRYKAVAARVFGWPKNRAGLS